MPHKLPPELDFATKCLYFLSASPPPARYFLLHLYVERGAPESTPPGHDLRPGLAHRQGMRTPTGGPTEPPDSGQPAARARPPGRPSNTRQKRYARTRL